MSSNVTVGALRAIEKLFEMDIRMCKINYPAHYQSCSALVQLLTKRKNDILFIMYLPSGANQRKIP
jgi:hypothetical protein